MGAWVLINAGWYYKLGGYQVLKKWLSYREGSILGRPLMLEEVQHFTNGRLTMSLFGDQSKSSPRRI